MKRILVNATQREELRVAIVDGQKLYNLDIEAAGKKQKKGNIYKGVIYSIAPSLDAVFVNYGGVRQGFLPTKEICRRYFNAKKGPVNSRTIHEQLKEGQEIIVQIVREELVNKGASITTYISLTGQYLVLMPDKPRVHGISQRITGKDRRRLLEMQRHITAHENEGVILRTACLNAKKQDLQNNLNYLRYLWKSIQKSSDERPGPFLIYKEANIVLQTIQNNLGPDIHEIIVDNQEVYEEIKEFLAMVLPHYKKKLKLYNDNTPLFNRMHIESQIESLYQHAIDLPSGGSIVLDHTEALTAIDINSARSTQQQDLEKTALTTNLEAIDEIAKQLRLRDLGGLLVIDFIDMLTRKNKRKVEEHLQELLKKDRARTRIGNISKFGLLEMSRQRLRPSLKEESQILCPRCSGQGSIRTTKSCALAVLRLIEEEAGRTKTNQVVGYVPPDIDKFLINEKRKKLDEIEQRYKIKVSIVSDPQMETPHYKIIRYKENDYANYKQNHAVSVRSSLPSEPTLNKQDQDEQEIFGEEVAAIPTVVTMEKRSFTEIFKDLGQKFLSLFIYKKRSNKQNYKRYRKQRTHNEKRTTANYRKKNRNLSKQDVNRKKNTSTQTNNLSSTLKRSAPRPKNESKSYGNSTHPYKKRRPFRNAKKQTKEDSASLSHQYQQPSNDTTKPVVPPTLHDNAQNKKPDLKPQSVNRDLTPNNIRRQPLFSNEKKLIQVETKIKKDNN